MESEEIKTDIWQDYENSKTYQASIGLAEKLPKFTRFYEGNQWPKATDKTKNMPRPVINIIKMICRNKKSAILSAPVNLVYEAENEIVDVEKFNRFASYIQKEIGQEALDKQAVHDGVIKGSYHYHYYWDSEAIGKDGVKEGALRCEVIDALNMHFANPREIDEQKQKWIIISSREEVSSVRAKADKDVDTDLITADTTDDKYSTIEQEGTKLCTVLTRYFRKDGEVYCEKATKAVVVNKAFPIAPDIEAAKKELGIDAPNNDLPDNHEEESLIPGKVRARLYPIVVGNYEKKEKCIYGLGEVEGLIPNQNAINFNVAMSLLNAQEIAWGKYVVHPKALQGQTIKNEPGQVIVDYTETMGGIKKMSEQGIQSTPMNLVESIMQMTRAVTGASEIMTGEAMGSNMSGAAIAQLQAQAQQPIEELRDMFWLVKEKQGKVLAQFFKLFYDDKEFSYKETVQSADEFGNPIIENGVPVTEEVLSFDTFNGAEYANTEFSVVVEATTGTKASAAGDINMLDTLYAKGAIDLRTYINAYPKDALSNRSELLAGIDKAEQSQIALLSGQVEQLSALVKQYESKIQADAKSVSQVSTLANENIRLKKQLAALYAEAKSKILAGNEQIALGNQRLAETTKDASDFAQMIASEHPELLYDSTQAPPV